MAGGVFAWVAPERSFDIGEGGRSPRQTAENVIVADFDIDAPERGELPDREGFEFGIPRGGTDGSRSRSFKNERRNLLEDLASVYDACIWVSANVDRIAAAVVAGGIALRPNDTTPDSKVPTVPPPEVLALLGLFRFTNQDENIIQVLRGFVTDLLIFGDAYLEIQWIAGIPAALYSLDSPSMTINADEHGRILGYKQEIDSQRQAEFEPHQVLHVKLKGARGGLNGGGPTRKSLVAAKTWLWASSTLNEKMRQGDPERLHVDLPEAMTGAGMKRWFGRFMMTNRGPKSVGTPIVTKGGGTVNVLGVNSIGNLLEVKKTCRDEMISEYGTPPSKVGVIETGNLGGGTGESQERTWRYDITAPLQELILEALQFNLVQRGFGITGFHLEFPQIDMRDKKDIEAMRDLKLRNGSWTLNEYLEDCGQAGIGPAGDVRVIIERGNFILWPDLPAYCVSEVLKNAPNLKVDRDDDGIMIVQQIEPIQPQPAAYALPDVLPQEPALPALTPPALPSAPSDEPNPAKPDAKVVNPDLVDKAGKEEESASAREARTLVEAANRAFSFRRKRALKELP